MRTRRSFHLLAAAVLGVAATGLSEARAQFGGIRAPTAGRFGGGFSSLGGQYGSGMGYGGGGGGAGQYGSGVSYGGLGGFGAGPSYGYGINSGQVGPGYQSAYGLNRRAYTSSARTTVALQSLYSAITSLPGWSGPTRHFHHRARYYPRSNDPPYPHYDHTGKILWPGMIHDDPKSAGLRRQADAAFEACFRESKTTGHASIRPVIAAKEKLSFYERSILPGIKAQSVPNGDYLERFFVDLDRSLDAMNAVF